MKITQKELKKKLRYFPETGDFVWLDPSKHHNKLKFCKAGSVRDSNGGHKRNVIRINAKGYFSSRLAFLYMTGKIPTIIDHVNGNSLDDRWSNLREVTPEQNNQNHHHKINGSNLPTGVRKALSGRFVARIRVHGNPLHLGTFNTIEEAAQVYNQARLEYHYCPRITGEQV